MLEVKQWVSYGETPVTVFAKWKWFSHVKILGNFNETKLFSLLPPFTFQRQCSLLQGSNLKQSHLLILEEALPVSPFEKSTGGRFFRTRF